MEPILNFLKEISDLKLFAIAIVVIIAMVLFRKEIGKKINSQTTEKTLRVSHKPNKIILYWIVGLAILLILLILIL